MYNHPLSQFINNHKVEIVKDFLDLLDQLPDSPYRSFIIDTKEGNRRLEIWVELVIVALNGRKDIFFDDQERQGYSRAASDFQFEFVVTVYDFFLLVLKKHIDKHSTKKERINLNLHIIELSRLLVKALGIAADSWVKTREAQIKDKLDTLQELTNMTQEIIVTFDYNNISRLILKRISTFFNVKQCYLVLKRNNMIYGYPYKRYSKNIKALIEKGMNEKRLFFIDERMNQFYSINKYDLKRIALSPIQAHGNFYGIIVLYNRTKGFRFTSKELVIFSQILHISAIALENAHILEDIDNHRKQLHLLNTKIISIQEDERKRLASDIHDTLAQALTGISYKVELCKELFSRNPKSLISQLDHLSNIIDHTVDQSRQLITSLHPDIIDIGLIPALQKHIDTFIDETGIPVFLNSSQSIDLSAEKNIFIYRIMQEALNNIRKHSNAKSVHVKLEKSNDNIIFSVTDDGKGIDSSSGNPWNLNHNKFGLFSIKERAEALAGKMIINSEIDKGYQILVTMPSGEENVKN